MSPNLSPAVWTLEIPGEHHEDQVPELKKLLCSGYVAEMAVATKTLINYLKLM
jgi:hypothetical protein